MFPSLYVIIDHEAADAAGWTVIDLATACLAGGARLLQVRAKRASSAWLVDTASEIVERARRAAAVVIVNDRADVARVAGADGVHVGQDDLTARLARAIVGDRAVIGLSTHTAEQMESALAEPISYVAVGPVFDTSTKATGYSALGVERVRQAAERARSRGVPLVAIGGITLDTAANVLRAGASSVAVITDLLTGGNPEHRVRAYIERLSG